MGKSSSQDGTQEGKRKGGASVSSQQLPVNISHRFRNSRSPPEKMTKNARELSYDVEGVPQCIGEPQSHNAGEASRTSECTRNAVELLTQIFSTYQSSAIGSFRPASTGIREGSTYLFGMIRD